MLDVVFGAEDAEGRAPIFAGIAERRRSLDRSAHSPFRFPGRLPLALRPRRRRALLARVVQRISFEPPAQPPRLEAGMVLRPAGGLPMVARRR